MVPVIVAPHLLPELTVSAQHWTRLPRSRRPGALARVVAVLRTVPLRPLAAAVGLCLVAQPIGQQDIAALLAAADTAPRWATRMVATGDGSSHRPTFTYAEASAADASAPRPVAALAGEGAPIVVAGYAPALPDAPMAEPRVER